MSTVSAEASAPTVLVGLPYGRVLHIWADARTDRLLCSRAIPNAATVISMPNGPGREWPFLSSVLCEACAGVLEANMSVEES